MELKEVRGACFTQIVSLGPGCALAYNLRRFFNLRSAFPFDWWITPIDGLVKVLRDNVNPQLIYDVAQLELTDNAGSVRHKTYDILLHHEFPRDREMQGAPVHAEFLQHIDEPRRRTGYLADKLLALDDRSEVILFVREPFPAGGTVNDSDIELVRAELARLFSRASWALAVVEGPVDESAFGWRRDPNLWDRELQKLQVTLDHGRHKPFVETEAYNTDENIRA